MGRKEFFRIGRRFVLDNSQINMNRPGKEFFAIFIDPLEIALTYPFENETIGRKQTQTILGSFFTLQFEWFDPRRELLGR